MDNLFAKLYEDRIAERITERNFIMLSAKYQEEQNALDGKIDLLNGQISENSERYSNIETWVKLIKQYASPTELDSILLNALVEKLQSTRQLNTKTEVESKRSRFSISL